jgi:hypothetical protein
MGESVLTVVSCFLIANHVFSRHDTWLTSVFRLLSQRTAKHVPLSNDIRGDRPKGHCSAYPPLDGEPNVPYWAYSIANPSAITPGCRIPPDLGSGNQGQQQWNGPEETT